jgi:hypothetical protein
MSPWFILSSYEGKQPVLATLWLGEETYRRKRQKKMSKINNIVFRVIMQCSLETDRRFGGTYNLHLQDRRLSQQETNKIEHPSAIFTLPSSDKHIEHILLRSAYDKSRASIKKSFL